jgi:hypothetical protein
MAPIARAARHHFGWLRLSETLVPRAIPTAAEVRRTPHIREMLRPISARFPSWALRRNEPRHGAGKTKAAAE